MTRFEEALASLEGAGDRGIPHVDRDTIVKDVTDLEHLGFLDPGARSGIGSVLDLADVPEFVGRLT